MQDKSTGEMVPLNPDLMENERLQAAMDGAIPDRERQGQLISIGQHVSIGHGRFKVTNIEGEYVTLRGLPVEPGKVPLSRGKGKKRRYKK